MGDSYDSAALMELVHRVQKAQVDFVTSMTRDFNTTHRIPCVRGSRHRAVAALCHAAAMHRDLRLVLYEKELRRLLIECREHDYAVFEDSRDEGRYVQFVIHDGAIYGEVGSRHWIPESEGLGRVSETALGCLGFEGARSRRNYSRDCLPHDARRLACLTELLFGAAYGEVEDMTPLVTTRASREAEGPRPAIEFDA